MCKTLYAAAMNHFRKDSSLSDNFRMLYFDLCFLLLCCALEMWCPSLQSGLVAFYLIPMELSALVIRCSGI